MAAPSLLPVISFLGFDFDLNDLFAFVTSAKRTDAMRNDGLAALGAFAKAGDFDFPMRAAFASSLLGMLSFW